MIHESFVMRITIPNLLPGNLDLIIVHPSVPFFGLSSYWFFFFKFKLCSDHSMNFPLHKVSGHSFFRPFKCISHDSFFFYRNNINYDQTVCWLYFLPQPYNCAMAAAKNLLTYIANNQHDLTKRKQQKSNAVARLARSLWMQ